MSNNEDKTLASLRSIAENYPACELSAWTRAELQEYAVEVKSLLDSEPDWLGARLVRSDQTGELYERHNESDLYSLLGMRGTPSVAADLAAAHSGFTVVIDESWRNVEAMNEVDGLRKELGEVRNELHQTESYLRACRIQREASIARADGWKKQVERMKLKLRELGE